MAYSPGGGTNAGAGMGGTGDGGGMGSGIGGGSYGGGGGFGDGIGGLSDGNIGGGWGGFDASSYGLDGGWADQGFSGITDGSFGPSMDATNTLGSMFGDESPAEMDSLVDTMTPEQRRLRMMKQLALPAAMQSLGPLGSLIGPAVSQVTGIQTPDQAARTGLRTSLGIAGSLVGGPVGGFVGSTVGGMMGSPTGPGPANGQGAGSSTSNGIDWMGAAGGLAQAYLNNKSAQDAKGVNQQMTSGVNQQLQDMFGPDSAYAQQMRQELARKDAAAGRRSQYGPREVELQARLAEMRARSQPGLMNAYTNQGNASLQAEQVKRQRQAQTLSTLFQIGKATGVNDRISKGIGGLFDSSPSAGGGWGSGNSFGNEDLGTYF